MDIKWPFCTCKWLKIKPKTSPSDRQRKVGLERTFCFLHFLMNFVFLFLRSFLGTKSLFCTCKDLVCPPARFARWGAITKLNFVKISFFYVLFLEQFVTGFLMDMVSFLFFTIFMLKMAIFYPKIAKMAIIGPHIAICKHQLVPNLTHKGLIWVPQMGRLSIYNGHTSKRNHSHRVGSVKMVYQQ